LKLFLRRVATWQNSKAFGGGRFTGVTEWNWSTS